MPPLLLLALDAVQDGDSWLFRALFAGLLSLSFWIAKRTVDQLDKVTEKTTDHGERLAVAETEIQNLKGE